MTRGPSVMPVQNYFLTVNVSEAGTGTPITDFKFIVNENNVGDSQVYLPAEQRWLSGPS